MIATLEEARSWYESVRGLTLAMQQLANKHWDSLPWDGDLGRDNRLRHLETEEILSWSQTVLQDLDDQCVLLLFSVFEANVRSRVLKDVNREAAAARHALVRGALSDLEEAIEHGSFYRVLDPYKGLDVGLVEEVNQVRRYRNWVAHGRRGPPPDAAVDPRAAFDRLRRFLDLLANAGEGNAGGGGVAPGEPP
jgi:hypothetical protein